MSPIYVSMASCRKGLQPCFTPVSDKRWKRIQWLQRAQWLGAAILGANDGLLSTTSLMHGIRAAKEDRESMILSGLTGAIADACSMAVGEFISVSTHRDIEVAITACRNLETKPVETKLRMSDELTPGRSPVMKVLTEDSKSKMKFEEDGETEEVLPNPYKEAAASGPAFLFGSFLPLASAAFITRNTVRIAVIAVASSIALALFGGFRSLSWRLAKQNIGDESSDRRMDCYWNHLRFAKAIWSSAWEEE